MTERTARVAAPAALALFVVIALVLSDQPSLPGALAAVLALAVGVTMAAARAGGGPLLAGCLVVLAVISYLCSGQPANLGWFGICVLAAWAALVGGTRPGAVYTAVVVVVVASQWWLLSSEPGWGAWIAGTVLTTVACLFARRQHELVGQLQAAQAGLAERTRVEERARIAREMHDVVGHALSVTLLHLGTARLALDDEPDRARAALEEAERNARRSLEEVRSSVGLLREDGQRGEVRPLPGAADLTDLVEAFRRAGGAVSCEVAGDVASLPASTGLAAYRIVQEALTNAARHAPGAATDVRVRVDGHSAVLTVDSAGPPGPRGEGTGLVGMRERAEALGGTASAGPSGPGWRVEAVLPT